MRIWIVGLLAAISGLVLSGAGLASQAGGDPVRGAELYVSKNCVGCHGVGAMGETGPALLGPQWTHGGDPASIAESIRNGFMPQMLPMGGAELTDPEIDDVIAFLFDRAEKLTPEERIRAAQNRPQGPPEGIVHTALEDFRVESLAKVGPPYAFAFLPNGMILISETAGPLRMFADGKLLPNAVAGAPRGDITGMTNWFRRANLSIALHPNYASNGWIYLMTARTMAKPKLEAAPIAITIHRGRLKNGRWVENEDVLTFPSHNTDSLRMKFDDKGFLYVGTPFSYKDYEGAGEEEPSQDLTRSEGKILRISDDGRVPTDNPFVSRDGAFPYIWSYGHREPSGLTFDGDGQLWNVENGPRGGDELNRVSKGRNYGWPVITWGHRYDAVPVGSNTARQGMEQPVVSWVPSPAVSDVEWYDGAAFPRWKGSFLVGSFKQRDLFRVTVEGDRATLIETVLHNVDRIRDIDTGPDGMIYLLTDSGDLYRMVPVEPRSLE
ncbi:MAG: PQQ-dependent sugar dehydrogenase [Novosphingobium sp.]|nr:PQQ-dependent sugar dehydrogenase [Novosphingobium sp.]